MDLHWFNPGSIVAIRWVIQFFRNLVRFQRVCEHSGDCMVIRVFNKALIALFSIENPAQFMRKRGGLDRLVQNDQAR